MQEWRFTRVFSFLSCMLSEQNTILTKAREVFCDLLWGELPERNFFGWSSLRMVQYSIILCVCFSAL